MYSTSNMLRTYEIDIVLECPFNFNRINILYMYTTIRHKYAIRYKIMTRSTV